VRRGRVTLVRCCVFVVLAGRSARSRSCGGRLRLSDTRGQGEMLPKLRGALGAQV
jgi:hypothetical protein